MTKSTSILWSLPFALLVLGVGLMPLAFGGVPDAAVAFGALVFGMLWMCWALVSLMTDTLSRLPLRSLAVPLALYALVLLWAVLQIVPFTPACWHHPLWEEAGRVLGRDIPSRISIDPEAGMVGIMRLLSYAAVFWLAVEYGRGGRRAVAGMTVFVVLAGLNALHGLILHSLDVERVLWVEKTWYRGDVTASFINHNNFASFAGLGVVVAAGLLARVLAGEGDERLGPRERARRRIEQMVRTGWLPLASFVVLFAALILSHSRAGLISALSGLAVLGVLGMLGGAFGRRGWRFVLLAVPVLLLIGAGLYGKDITGRFAHLSDDMAMRANIYATTERAIADAPLLGTGLGTFAPVFRMYRGEDIETRIVNAHNTYLENALELGIPAAAMLTLAVLLVVLICLKGVGARRRNRILPAIGVAASVHVGLHALVDFGLETPAVTWAYAFILGLAAGQSFSSKANRQKC